MLNKNHLVQPGMLKIPVESSCNVDISKFSLDNYKTFNPEGYTIFYYPGETTNGLSYFPGTSKIVINSNQQNLLVENFEQFILSLAQHMGVSQATATERSVDFFSDKQLVFQPVELQWEIYTAIQAIQNYTPMACTSQTVTLLKTTVMTGVQVIARAFLTFVGATYIGATFFGYCGSVAGANSLGLIFNSTSFVLSRPIRGVEIVLNGLVLRPISNTIGLPLVLNGTQEMLAGKGLSLQKYTKIGIAFERVTNSNTFKKIYKIIRNKDK